MANGRGLPVRLIPTPGQASGRTTAPELVVALGDVVGDRGDFGQAVIAAVEASGATARTPGQSDVRVLRSVDREL